MYTDFARVYDRLMADVDYTAWSDHLIRLLNRYLPPDKRRCTECACGTGSLTIPLAMAGFEMTGIDLSREMLNVAAEKAASSGVRIPFLCQDMRHFSAMHPQDAILATCDGVNYLDMAGFASFAKSAFACLSPDGVLIFDLSTPYKLQTILGNNSIIKEYDDCFCVWQNRFNTRKSCVDMDLDIFVREGEKYIRLREEQRQWCHSEEEVHSVLQKAGFNDIIIKSKFSNAIARQNDDRWHVIAIKK